MAKKKSLKREVIEWALFIGVITTLYVTGLHTPVLGALQGLMLKTGLMQPSINDNDYGKAEYNFDLTDVDGNTVSFEEFKGKTIFVNFWATWCPPCVAEMPDINDLYLEMKEDENIVFVLVSYDKDFEKAKAFVDRKSFEMPVYQLRTKLPKIYESSSIPTTYVISPEGKIVVSKKGMAKYNTDKFKKYLVSLSNPDE